MIPARRATRIITGVAAALTPTLTRSAANALSSDGIGRGGCALGPCRLRSAEVANHVSDRILHSPLGLPADQLVDGAGVRDPLLEVLEAGLVSDVEGDEPDSRGGARPLDHEPGEVDDPDRVGGADVVDVADR